MLPSRSATSPCGPESGVFNGYSLNWPVFGSSRTSLLAICPVYQREPSGARAGSWGRDFGVGTSHSLMVTFGGRAVIVSATIRQMNAGAKEFRIRASSGKERLTARHAIMRLRIEQTQDSEECTQALFLLTVTILVVTWLLPAR